MSKGSKIVPVRVPEELLLLLDSAIVRSQGDPTRTAWTRTSYILQAIIDKLNHSARSRKKTACIPTTFKRDKHNRNDQGTRKMQRQVLINMAAASGLPVGDVIHHGPPTNDPGATRTDSQNAVQSGG